MPGVLALRFDVDSVVCVEQGIPKLRDVADRLGVRFTFFVNMGYSFNASLYARHALSKAERPRRDALPVTKKLGWSGVLRTVLLNPRLGERYRRTFDELFRDGHELGLHGGTDHVVWQRSLERLDGGALDRLYGPAYSRFAERYGRPVGFASPGFVYDERVLEIIDRDGFVYASDMSGEEPFKPERAGGGYFEHYQVPVNVIGEGRVPVIEQGLARGHPPAEIVERAVADIRTKPFALMYGHPYVEGIHSEVTEEVIRQAMDTHEVVSVGDYLGRWRAAHE